MISRKSLNVGTTFQARQLSDSLGIPLSYVLPVKNYSEELELDQNTDILLFMVLQQMLNYADSFFENQITDNRDEGTVHPRRVVTERNEPKVV